MPHPIRRLALFAALVTSAACAARKGEGPEDAITLPPPVVVFNNQSIYQASVYALTSSGSRLRIGVVQAGRRESLHVPSSAMGGDRNVTFVARMLSRNFTPSSGSIGLMPGDTIEVILTNDGTALTVLPVARRP